MLSSVTATSLLHDSTEPTDCQKRIYGEEYFRLKTLNLEPVSQRQVLLEPDYYHNLAESQQNGNC